MEKRSSLHSHGTADSLTNIKKRKIPSMEKCSSLLFDNPHHTLPIRKKRKNKFEGRNGLAYFFHGIVDSLTNIKKRKGL